MIVKILIVEDEPGLQIGLADLFQEAGYETNVCGEGRQAMALAASFEPDLAILDLGLPDMDGAVLLRWFRQQRPELPVIVLTARANESDVVLGFKQGAFDYVTKPFSPRILLARVDAIRDRRAADAGPVRLGALLLDFERYEASSDGEPLHLTTREMDILKLLHTHEGRPVSRHDILDEVWGMSSDAGPRTVDTHIALLRKKVEPNPEKPVYILSQRGIGYKLNLKA